jgi:4a-hydroxytetrahydrobiopterin dehydratase
MAVELAKAQCEPCSGRVPPLAGAQLATLQGRLPSEWQVIDGHHLEREFAFADYAGSVDFTNRVAAIAEKENHHPEILLSYGRVKVSVWTHKIDGLTLNDFILAAKVETAYKA